MAPAIVLIVPILLVGCSGTAVSTTDDVPPGGPTAPFSEVVVTGPADVTLAVADDYGTTVTGDEVDAVSVAVADDTLTLQVDGDLSARAAVTVSLPAGELVVLELSDAAAVSTLDALEGLSLDVTISTGSSAQLTVDGVQELELTVLDGSTATASGEVESLVAVASDASSLHLFELESADVSAQALDRSTVEVTATDVLDATASEVSTIAYRGSPSDVTEDATELSTITAD